MTSDQEYRDAVVDLADAIGFKAGELRREELGPFWEAAWITGAHIVWVPGEQELPGEVSTIVACAKYCREYLNDAERLVYRHNILVALRGVGTYVEFQLAERSAG